MPQRIGRTDRTRRRIPGHAKHLVIVAFDVAGQSRSSFLSPFGGVLGHAANRGTTRGPLSLTKNTLLGRFLAELTG